MLFSRMERLIEGQSEACALFSGPYYFAEQLGKTAGKDTAAEKATYPALFGVDESLKKAGVLVDSALASLDGFGSRADVLKSLARFLVDRKK